MLPTASPSDDDLLLLEQLKEGREQAWQAIFERYHDLLFYQAYYILSSEEEARDMVQDLFYKLWTNRETLAVNTSLKAYLCQGVRNKSLNRLRTLNTRKKHIEQMAYLQDRETGPSGESATEQERLELVRGAIRELSGDRNYPSFRLMALEGKSSLQASRQLGLHPGTLRSQVSRFLDKLRKKISG